MLSAAFGVLLFARPGEGALAVIFTIGMYAVLLGILMLMLAFKLKGLPGRVAAA